MEKEKGKLGHSSEIKNIRLSFPGAKNIEASLKRQLASNKKYIIAISGGPDSMLAACVVYHFFSSQKWDLQNLILVHCNHKVRPESDQEAKFIQKFFKGCKLIIATRTTKVSKITEETLRTRRYAEFQNIIKKEKAEAIIFGHNLTDRVETTFLNMLRGAHLKGFLAMREYENHPLLKIPAYRPLLHLAKKNILDICSRFGIPFVIDPTNADVTSSRRNKLRNIIFPSLYALAHKPETFLQSWENIYAELEKTTEKKLFTLKPITACSLRKAKFAYEVLSTSHERTNDTTAQMLHALGIARNIQGSQITELTKFFTTAEQGYKYFQGTYFFLAHGRRYAIQAPVNFREKVIEKNKKIATLGQAKRENFTLPIIKKERLGTELRFVKATDRYHGKTRNQYCIRAKIPVFRRNFVPVLIKKGLIVHVFKDFI